MNENEKDKEIKKTPEAYSYDDYEGEEMEDAEESPGLEETSESEGSLLSDICETVREISVSESPETEPGSSQYSEEERHRRLLREKWQNLTGKKPRNIPLVRKQYDEFNDKFVFFGDRKPGEAEKAITRKLLLSYKRFVEELDQKLGKVRHEVMLPALFCGLVCVRFQPGGECLALGDRRGEVQVLKTSTGKTTLTLKTLEMADKLPIRGLKYFLNTEKLFVGGFTGVIQVFDTYDGKLIGSSHAMGTINNLDINVDGNYVATVGREGRVSVLDPQTFQIISRREWPENSAFLPNASEEYHKLRIYGLKFHPRETNIFVTGGWDACIKIWDARTHAAIRSIKCPMICGDGVDVSENKIITASWQVENSLNLWDFHSGKLIKNIPINGKFTKFEGEFLYTAKFFEDNPAYPMINSNMVAVGGSGFTEAVVVDTRNAKVLQIFPSLKAIICMDVCGNMLAYGGKESLMRISEFTIKRNTQPHNKKKIY